MPFAFEVGTAATQSATFLLATRSELDQNRNVTAQLRCCAARHPPRLPPLATPSGKGNSRRNVTCSPLHASRPPLYFLWPDCPLPIAPARRRRCPPTRWISSAM